MSRVTGGLQHACVATVEIVPSDIKDWSASTKLATIPNDAVVTRGWVHVLTAFDDSGALTGNFGHGSDPNYFNAVPIDLKTEAVTALDAAAVNGVQYPSTTEVECSFPAGNGEVGKAVLYIEYMRPGAAHGVG